MSGFNYFEGRREPSVPVELRDTDQAPYSAPVNTGGAAFPQFEVVAGERDGHGDAIDTYTAAKGGMTLRDYLAAKAMSGIANGYWSNPNMSGLSPHNIADEAYQLADAMLAAREVRK